jgi:predicted PurR-regulated permease PerM
VQDVSAIQRLLLFGLFFGLMLLSFQVLKFFVVPVVWAAILAYITWPIYQAILRGFGQRHNLSALTMTTILSVVIGVPFIMAIFLLQLEGRDLYVNLQRQIFSGGIVLPDFMHNIPIIGPELSKFVAQINAHPHDLARTIRSWMQGHVGYGRVVLSEISRNIFKLT